MKITYIANARIPTEKAHGIQIMQMCKSFALCDANILMHTNDTNNIEVQLVIPQRFNPIKESPFDYYGIERNFKIKKLPCLDLIPFGKYIGHLAFWVQAFSFLFFVILYTLFKKSDIIYTRDRLLLSLVLFKENLIFEAHSFPKNYFLYSPYLKRLNKIVVITQKLKNIFVAKGIPAEKILVAPDGVDLEKFDIKEMKGECRKKINLPQDKKIVLYTGHLYGWKGANVLAKASQYLPTDVEIYFVGGTKKDIQRFKSNIQYPISNIQIVGHRPHSEIPYWLKAADCLVLPNSAKAEISRYWTSPMKMFEYMASKRPIVASDLPSLREILNEENSILVKSDDPEALAEGIKKVLQNPQLSDKISQQAFQDVQQYTWQKRAQRILDFVRESQRW